ncbi:hypothetical protein [Mucilaginibacter gossypii]|uniref:Uncharacterized protein n=2 Tax=Mucilaginibacter TaxID=423349 RepID=A0A1G8D408_9SPHI|nr:hypothetical protein [Mucilaginibacter gossypii]SDH52455.1 hypothetical protein SAMN05192573_110118 [Mucilaginibacter gossypii]
MSLTPKLAPKSLNEWTLEMNITRELCNMFDSPFGLLYPVRLRRIFDIQPFGITRFWRRRAWSEKLAPREEGTGGGWDTKITIPQDSTADERAIYIQFKCGTHSEGNHINGSMFSLGVHNPNPHIEFSFNDNGKPAASKPGNQHNALGVLNNYLIENGCTDRSVLYAFPRIKDRQAMSMLTQPLIYYTTFMSLKEMDQEAGNNHANLYDGDKHSFRSCYIDERRREISSEPFALSGEIESVNILREYMQVRLARVWNEVVDDIREDRLRDYLVVALCEELRIDPFELVGEPFEYFNPPSFEFRRIEDSRRQNERLVFGEGAQGLNRMNTLFKLLYSFIRELKGVVDINSLPANFSSILPQQTIEAPDNVFDDELGGSLNLTRLLF